MVSRTSNNITLLFPRLIIQTASLVNAWIPTVVNKDYWDTFAKKMIRISMLKNWRIRSSRLGCSSNPASLPTVSLPIVSLPAVYAENFYLKANFTIFIYLRIAKCLYAFTYIYRHRYIHMYLCIILFIIV